MKSLILKWIATFAILIPCGGALAATAPHGLVLYTDPPGTYVETLEFVSITNTSAVFATAVLPNGPKQEISRAGILAIINYPPATPTESLPQEAATALRSIQTLRPKYPQFAGKLDAAQTMWTNSLEFYRQRQRLANATPTKFAPTLKLEVDGTTYSQVELTSFDGATVGISHSAGVARIPAIKLKTEQMAALNSTSTSVRIDPSKIVAEASAAPVPAVAPPTNSTRPSSETPVSPTQLELWRVEAAKWEAEIKKINAELASGQQRNVTATPSRTQSGLRTSSLQPSDPLIGRRVATPSPPDNNSALLQRRRVAEVRLEQAEQQIARLEAIASSATSPPPQPQRFPTAPAATSADSPVTHATKPSQAAQPSVLAEPFNPPPDCTGFGGTPEELAAFIRDSWVTEELPAEGNHHLSFHVPDISARIDAVSRIFTSASLKKSEEDITAVRIHFAWNPPHESAGRTALKEIRNFLEYLAPGSEGAVVELVNEGGGSRNLCYLQLTVACLKRGDLWTGLDVSVWGTKNGKEPASSEIALSSVEMMGFPKQLMAPKDAENPFGIVFREVVDKRVREGDKITLGGESLSMSRFVTTLRYKSASTLEFTAKFEKYDSDVVLGVTRRGWMPTPEHAELTISNDQEWRTFLDILHKYHNCRSDAEKQNVVAGASTLLGSVCHADFSFISKDRLRIGNLVLAPAEVEYIDDLLKEEPNHLKQRLFLLSAGIGPTTILIAGHAGLSVETKQVIALLQENGYREGATELYHGRTADHQFRNDRLDAEVILFGSQELEEMHFGIRLGRPGKESAAEAIAHVRDISNLVAPDSGAWLTQRLKRIVSQSSNLAVKENEDFDDKRVTIEVTPAERENTVSGISVHIMRKPFGSN